MRKLALMAVAALAACSGGAENKADDEPAVVQLQPGQWEMTTEITNITMTQKGAPTAPVKAGTKVTMSNCITEAQVKAPDATVFAGTGGTCKYDNFYMANGRLNAQMTCKQPGTNGNLMMNVDGQYTATTMNVESDVSTYVVGAGDMKMSSKLTGKRIGECVAAPETQAKS